MAFNYVRKLKAADGLDYLFRDIERSIHILGEAPTKDTGTFINEDGGTSTFVPGDYCRVQNSEAEMGYDFFLLKDDTGGVYSWEKQAIHRVKTGDAEATTMALRAAIAGEDQDSNVTYSDVEAHWDVTSLTVPASGGSVTCPGITYSQVKTTKNEDGTTTNETITSGAQVTYWTYDSDLVVDPSELRISVDSCGTTGSGIKTVGQFNAYVELNDKGISMMIYVNQEANTVVDIVEPEIISTSYDVLSGPDGNDHPQVVVTGQGKRAWASGSIDSYKTKCDLKVTGVSSSNESAFIPSFLNNVVTIDPVGKNYSLKKDLKADINIYGELSYENVTNVECPAATVHATQKKDMVISDFYDDIYVDGVFKYNNVDRVNTVIRPVSVPMLRQDRYTTYLSGKTEEQQYLLNGEYSIDDECYFVVVKDNTTGEIEVFDNNEARRSFTVNIYAENGGKHIIVSTRVEQAMGNPYALVDLGLASGTRWCAANIGADVEGVAGELFTFGDVNGHGSDYLFNRENYGVVNNGASLKSDFTQGDTKYDAATMNAGSGKGVPTVEQIIEMLEGTDQEHIESETENYWKIKSRRNDNYIILSIGSIWTNHVVDGTYAKALVIGDELKIMDKERHSGASVRGVEI